MVIKTFKTEHYQDYKVPSMFIACKSCTFKCDKECKQKICQNSHLAQIQNIDVSIDFLIQQYIENPITQAIIFGGLEPFDDIQNVLEFIEKFRASGIEDNVVIYTGYTKEEIIKTFKQEFKELKNLNNIIIKYGRFIPNNIKHFDNILGTYLSSNNQYAEQLT